MNLSKLIAGCLLLFMSLTPFCRERQQKANIEKIVIHYVDLQIETPFDVTCENFDNFFSSSYKAKIISNKNQLRKFADYLAHCDVLDGAKNVDVRVKAVITYFDGKTTVLCMNKFNDILINNKLIKENKSIIAFVRKQINE